MTFWTDYPITEFGDESNQPAPWRECIILGVADHKRLKVLVKGEEVFAEALKEIKALPGGYIYCHKGDRSTGVAIWHEDSE
tara:strand:+ start:259 stop:501 length:243 start_codon:yes stop_codon:yes gene_type:complete